MMAKIVTSTKMKKTTGVKKSLTRKKVSIGPKKENTTKVAPSEKADGFASKQIDGRINELKDWRGDVLARIRALVKQAVPEVIETWKWRGVPVWESAGIICTGETYQSVVKMTFAKGAELKDPSKLFNSSLDGNVRRAIDIRETDKINEKALKALLIEAAALNSTATAKKRPKPLS
jgi:hypothetical protein